MEGVLIDAFNLNIASGGCMSAKNRILSVNFLFVFSILLYVEFLNSRYLSAKDLSDTVTKSEVSIQSDGTRLSGTVFIPNGPQNSRYPAIAMAHGWGGEATQLFQYAEKFAEAGYFVLVFDYRGWGKSDSRYVQVKDPITGELKLVEYSGIVDPLDQVEDYFSAVNWLASDPRVALGKIGLWGTSWSGGTVVYVAARDERVKAIVSQVSPVGWPYDTPEARKTWLEIGGDRARGTRLFPKPLAREVGNLRGAMIYEKLVRFTPRDDVRELEHCASLFIVAEYEELFNNETTAFAAYKRASGVADYQVLPGATHYSVYSGTHAQAATDKAIDWFDKYLR